MPQGIAKSPQGNVPLFMDFEATSLSRDSYPIQIAWSTDVAPLGEIRSYLINPESVPDWLEWDDMVEDRFHRISQQDLVRQGLHPKQITDHLSRYAGRVFYVDGGDADAFWLKRLYRAAGERIPFELGDARALIASVLRERGFFMSDGQARTTADFSSEMDEMARKARADTGGRRHLAHNDVRYLVNLWNRALNWHP